jgi:hypothetical protein
MNTRMFPGHYNHTQENYCSTVRSGATLDCNPQESPEREKQSVLVRTNIQSAFSLSQTDQERLLRRQALEVAQQGKYDEAIVLFDQLIGRNPVNASDFNNRGLLHFRNSNPERALADYNEALQLNPQLAKVYNNRANCYASLGQLAEAIADYETAIDLDPTNIHARINQGITFRDLEMYDQAIENFDLALRFNQILQGGSDSSSFLEGHIYAERGRTHHLAGDWNCAVADYQRTLLGLSQTNPLTTSASYRLQLQVEAWLDKLLKPLLEGCWEEDAEL